MLEDLDLSVNSRSEFTNESLRLTVGMYNGAWRALSSEGRSLRNTRWWLQLGTCSDHLSGRVVSGRACSF